MMSSDARRMNSWSVAHSEWTTLFSFQAAASRSLMILVISATSDSDLAWSFRLSGLGSLGATTGLSLASLSLLSLAEVLSLAVPLGFWAAPSEASPNTSPVRIKKPHNRDERRPDQPSDAWAMDAPPEGRLVLNRVIPDGPFDRSDPRSR